jgi:acetyltransferase-like isoleucine patch superfamily enzyme
MGLIAKVFSYKSAGIMRLRGMILTLMLRALGCKTGKGLRASGWPIFRLYPSGNITIGNNLTLGKDVTFEIAPEATLSIGNKVYLSDRVVLSTLTKIAVGDWVSIAENTGIRGSFHQLKASELAVAQPSDSEPVRIDRGVGIGANTTILMGVHLPEGAIVGANSVLNSKVKYEPNGIYAGSPARLLKFRE